MRKAADIFDPAITSKGLGQCRDLNDQFPNKENITLIMSSPSARTRHIALLGFESLFEDDMQMVLWHQLRDWGPAPCNRGLSKEEFEAKNNKLYDLGMLKQGWEKEPEAGHVSVSFSIIVSL